MTPLRCPKCDAAVPLTGAVHGVCAYCHARVDVPGRYRELFKTHALEVHARDDLEHRYREAARPPAKWCDRAAVLLVLVAPTLVAVLRVVLAHHPIETVTLFAAAIVPAMLPGTALWMWSAAVHATVVRMHLALVAMPPERDGGPPECRQCGAPLAVDAGTIFARCAYCGTDSLIENVAAAVRRIQAALGEELRTIAQAITALRARRRLIVAGAVVAAVIFAGLLAALLAAYGRLV